MEQFVTDQVAQYIERTTGLECKPEDFYANHYTRHRAASGRQICTYIAMTCFDESGHDIAVRFGYSAPNQSTGGTAAHAGTARTEEKREVDSELDKFLSDLESAIFAKRRPKNADDEGSVY